MRNAQLMTYNPDGSTCPHVPYSGEEICDGIDNDSNGIVDRALLNGEKNPLYDQRICPVICYQNDTHTIEERLNYLGEIEERKVVSDFCLDINTMARWRCDWDLNCIGRWAFVDGIYCNDCIDIDGSTNYDGDNSNNVPASCK